jgi:hypothetical protein
MEGGMSTALQVKQFIAEWWRSTLLGQMWHVVNLADRFPVDVRTLWKWWLLYEKDDIESFAQVLKASQHYAEAEGLDFATVAFHRITL